MENLINVKNIAGVGVGLALGHFVFKSKSPLVLVAFGLGGGILAHHLLKSKSQTTAQVNQDTNNYLQQVSEDVNATLNNVSDEASSVEGIKFNPKYGYMMPYGTIEEDNPSEFMDIRF